MWGILILGVEREE